MTNRAWSARAARRAASRSLELTRAAQGKGLASLLADARDKVHQGLTTVEEVLRVLGPSN